MADRISRIVATFSSVKSSPGNAAYIVAAKRTPIAAFMGKLSALTGP